MDAKRPIPLNYADDATRLEERGPIPDGYLGHRATPEEEPDLEDEGTQFERSVEEWTITLLVGPFTFLLILGMIFYFFIGSGR